MIQILENINNGSVINASWSINRKTYKNNFRSKYRTINKYRLKIIGITIFYKTGL